MSLLDDPDELVYLAVRNALVREGVGVVPTLESTAKSIDSDVAQSRIRDIIRRVQHNNICSLLIDWVRDGAENLLYGAYLVALYQYPNLEYYSISHPIVQLVDELKKLDTFKGSPVSNVGVLNKHLFGTFGFVKNLDAPMSYRNNCLNEVFKNHKGNHLTLSVIYSVVATQLGLPIYCVSLPRVMILAYLDEKREKSLFFLNAAHNGDTVSEQDIRLFLNQQNIEIEPKYFLPCPNTEIVRHMLQNMFYSFEVVENRRRSHEINELIEIIDKYSK